MDTMKTNLQKIKSVNPRLSDEECLIIHNFMDHMSTAIGRINLGRLTLGTVKGVMEEFFPQYTYGTSVITDAKIPFGKIEAVLVSLKGIEFNVFLEDDLKIVVFREENPYRHIFEISASI